ncbi:MAG: glycosyltransferase family 4 protein [Propylenella sp.]
MTGEIRICVVGLRGMPGVMGGVESHCEQLYPHIARAADMRIVVFARRPYMKRRELFTYRGTTVLSIWAFRSKHFEALFHTGWAIILARFRHRPDIVHIHGVGPGFWSPVARLLGLKVVVTHHGKDYNREKWNALAKTALQLGEHLSIRFANAIIVVNRELSQQLRALSPQIATKISYIPNGADHLDALAGEADRSDSPLAQLGLSPQKYVLAVGRLTPEKGFQDLLEAHALSGMKEYPLVIVGDADRADAFSKELLDHRSDGVVFAGFQPQSALRTLYRNAALFVSPSHHEGNPIVALEAISQGAPVLLSDIGPHRELGLSPDHYFPASDIEALARKLMLPPDRYRCDPEPVMERFNWPAAARETERLYRSLAPG